MDVYRNAAWPTRDRVIPFLHFYALLGAMGHVAAAEQYRAYYATSLGVANAMASTPEARDGVNDAVDRMRKLAFPEVPRR